MRALSVDRQTARRAVLAHLGLLAAAGRGGPRPWRGELTGAEGVHEALRRLECVQVDPISVVERNHNLVLFNRVDDYQVGDLEALFPLGRAFEYLANARCILPIESVADFWPILLQARANAARADETLQRAMQDVLEHLRDAGPTAPRQIGDDGPRLMGIGYMPDVASKASGRAIDLLWLGGLIMIAARQGNEKVYDLTERVLPKHVMEALPGEGDLVEDVEAGAPLRPWAAPVVRSGGRARWSGMLLRRYLRAFGLADPGDFRFGWQKWPAAERRQAAEDLVIRGEAVRVSVEGVRRVYYGVPEVTGLLERAGDWRIEPEVRLIAPLDQLLWRRERLADLFEFEYVWEVYVPEAKRKFGYYTLPILYGDRLVGRIDPKLHRDRGALEVRRAALEQGFEPDDAFVDALAVELARFAGFHDAGKIEAGRFDGHDVHRKALRAAVRAAARRLRGGKGRGDA